jgi:pimeloyl-ACP methyl ester carboxylesterase
MSVVAFPAARKACVVALHCSGASGRAWDRLRQMLGDGFSMIAPDLIGCGSSPHWMRRDAFRLTHEAAAAVAAIDALDEPVHLVGHSYGGGVALRVALERPRRIASLSLYEPTLFAVLGMMGDEGRASRAEIAAVATDVERHVNAGVPANAARRFVDYWNHPGAFDALKPEAQTEIVRYIPKASLDFGALFNEPVSLEALRGLRIPLLMLRGENAPQPAALIAQKLASVMRAKAFVTVPGAGHMGPFSHADAVNRAIAQHIGGADLGTAQAQANAAA